MILELPPSNISLRLQSKVRMMTYQHIVFDIDGTLIDTEHAVLHGLQDTLTQLTGETLPLESLTFSLGIPGDATLRRLGIPDIAGAAGLWNRLMRRYESSITVFDGIIPLLEALSRRGCTLGVVTSQTREELAGDFLRLGLGPRFSTVITASDTALHKPHPDPLLRYLERASAQRSHTLYLGDSEYDSQCAQAAGVDFALALWGCRGRDVPARHRLSTPLDLLSLL